MSHVSKLDEIQQHYIMLGFSPKNVEYTIYKGKRYKATIHQVMGMFDLFSEEYFNLRKEYQEEYDEKGRESHTYRRSVAQNTQVSKAQH